MGLRRSPDQTRFMQRRIEIGECCRTEVVDVLGELDPEELVSVRGRNPGIEQDPGREPGRRSQQRERTRALLVNVEGKQRPHLRSHLFGGLDPGPGCGVTDILGRSARELLHMDPLHTSLHPWTERCFDGISEVGCIRGESPEILVRGTGGLCSGIFGVHEDNGDPDAPSFAHRTHEPTPNSLMRIRALSVFEHVVYHCCVVDPSDPARPSLEVEAVLRDGDADGGPLLLSIADYIAMVGGLEAARPCLDRFRADGRIVDHLGVAHLAFPLWTPVVED